MVNMQDRVETDRNENEAKTVKQEMLLTGPGPGPGLRLEWHYKEQNESRKKWAWEAFQKTNLQDLEATGRSGKGGCQRGDFRPGYLRKWCLDRKTKVEKEELFFLFWKHLYKETKILKPSPHKRSSFKAYKQRHASKGLQPNNHSVFQSQVITSLIMYLVFSPFEQLILVQMMSQNIFSYFSEKALSIK